MSGVIHKAGLYALVRFILLIGRPDEWMGWFLIGFALGIEYDVVAFLTARYFGMRAYAAIYSLLYVCFSTGAGLAPLVFGVIRDRTHDFAPALWLSAGLLPLCSAAFLLLGRYPVAWKHQLENS